MEVTTIERRSLSEAVFEQLRDRILSGDIAPGAALPSERVLCEQLGVNRAALREALKRLQQLHLVVVHQGEPTRVLDHEEVGGLELLIPMLFKDGSLRADVARSLVQLRSVLGPDIARLAALNRSDDQVVALRAALTKMQQLPRDDAVALQRVHLQIWRVLILASKNVAYRLAFNTMQRAWEGVQDALAPALMDEIGYLAGYEKLVQAVERGWHQAARKAATKLVDRGARRMNLLIDAAAPSTGALNA